MALNKIKTESKIVTSPLPLSYLLCLQIITNLNNKYFRKLLEIHKIKAILFIFNRSGKNKENMKASEYYE